MLQLLPQALLLAAQLLLELPGPLLLLLQLLQIQGSKGLGSGTARRQTGHVTGSLDVGARGLLPRPAGSWGLLPSCLT